MLKLATGDPSGRAALWADAAAIVSVAAAAAGLHLLETRVQVSAPVSMFLVAVVISAWLGGKKPGLLATALSLLAFNYYYVGLGAAPESLLQVVRLLSFAAVASYVVWITTTERRAAESLRRARDTLQRNNDALVAENTERRRTEEQLRTSEAKFRALSEHAPAAIFIARGERIDYANPAASEITGYLADELHGMGLGDLAHADFRDLLAGREQARRRREPVTPRYELKIVTKAGKERWLDLTDGTFEFGGEPAVLSIALDITERVQAEAALRKSERVLREAEELGHTGSWENDLTAGEIFHTPGNLRLLFGDDRMNGANFENCAGAMHPDDHASGMARHQKLLEDGEPVEAEYRVVWPDGSIHVLFGRAAAVRDASGRNIRIYGTNVDITEHKRADEAVRQSQQLLNLVVETLPVGVFVVDGAGDVALANAASQRIWGEPLIRSGPERWARSPGYWHDSGRRILPGEWPSVRALSHGQTTLNELMDIDAFDGRRKTIQASAAPIRNGESAIVGAVIVIEDVTERVSAERALQESANRLQQLSRRLLAVQEEERSHLSRELHDEFGQLLATTTLHLHAARRVAGEPAQTALDEAMSVLQRAGTQLRSLALELRPRMLETAGLDGTLRWLAEQHQQRTGVAAEVLGHLSDVSGDLAIACFRVAQEALTNVARHAAARHVWIELARTDGLLQLVIRDDGVGFDVRRTLDGAASHCHLGLVGMKERVEILRGNLEVDSEPGRGTSLRITLPLHAPPAPPPTERST